MTISTKIYLISCYLRHGEDEDGLRVESIGPLLGVVGIRHDDDDDDDDDDDGDDDDDDNDKIIVVIVAITIFSIITGQTRPTWRTL